MRQPDICMCFGGRCWKQFCHNLPKKARVEEQVQPKERNKYHKNKVLTLSESLAEIKKDKSDNE